jgi:hypothetical protein
VLLQEETEKSNCIKRSPRVQLGVFVFVCLWVCGSVVGQLWVSCGSVVGQLWVCGSVVGLRVCGFVGLWVCVLCFVFCVLCLSVSTKLKTEYPTL